MSSNRAARSLSWPCRNAKACPFGRAGEQPTNQLLGDRLGAFPVTSPVRDVTYLRMMATLVRNDLQRESRRIWILRLRGRPQSTRGAPFYAPDRTIQPPGMLDFVVSV